MIRRLTGLSSMATRRLLADLAASFEDRTGCRIDMISIGGIDAARRVRTGEVVDVIVLASDVMTQLANEGHIVAGTRADIVRSGMAMAIRDGARRPVLASEDDLRQAILAARRIGYSTGPSGQHLQQVFERWGIAGLIADRVVEASAGVSVASLVAAGQVDIGFQQLSEMIDVPGIKVVETLPPSVQTMTVFTAGISALSSNPDDAQAFVTYLTSPETHATKRRYGLEPADRAG